MKILAAITTQLEREAARLIEPAEKKIASDILIGIVQCEESRRLYKLWRLATSVHNKKINEAKEAFLTGQPPKHSLKSLLLSDAKVDCLGQLLFLSVASDFPQLLLELDRFPVLCQGWEVVMRRKEDDSCTDPKCPVHGQEAIIGVMRKVEC